MHSSWGDDSPPPNSQSYLIYNLISLMKSSRNIICKLYNINIVIVLSFLVQMLSNNRYCHATVLCQLIYNFNPSVFIHSTERFPSGTFLRMEIAGNSEKSRLLLYFGHLVSVLKIIDPKSNSAFYIRAAIVVFVHAAVYRGNNISSFTLNLLNL